MRAFAQRLTTPPPAMQAHRHIATPDGRRRDDAPQHQVDPRTRSSGTVSAKTSLRPHSDLTPETSRREAAIYARGKTPVRVGGNLVAWDAKPLGAAETGAHLSEIRREFGANGFSRSVQGLARTRGDYFARSAVEHSGAHAAALADQQGAIGSEAASAIRASRESGPLPGSVRERLAASSGHDFSDLAIHDDANAHRAAALMNARAFSLGRGLYFARSEYQPVSAAGMHLIAHEAAHAVQQRGHDVTPTAHFRPMNAADKEEREAAHFADSVMSPTATSQAPLTPSARTGFVRRAISFTHANDAFTTNPVAADETAAGFRLGSNPAPAFQWDTDVTIHGVAGDPFANFQVGFLQVERVFYANVNWGTGANRTHRAVRPDLLPRRDAETAASVFASDNAPYVRPAFAADGDVRSPSFNDTPHTQRMPWDNPVPPRVGTRGWFNYGDAFVTYLSARDTTAGAGAAAFRDLACVYWNLSASGSFDTTQAVGNRVTFTGAHDVNHSHVIEGASGEFPAMHGGTIANGHDVTTDT